MRQATVLIPKGEDIIMDGDVLIIVGEETDIKKFETSLERAS
jgi:K+/H+ antiporter YhaU regulatory subunit KhtT